MDTLVKNSPSTVFPSAEVEACIRDALADQGADQALLRPGRASTTTPVAPQSWQPEIDSLVVVEVICAVEELLGITLPATFAPQGGYDGIDACVNDLMSETQATWNSVTKREAAQ
jgi:acyl carrier protein